MRQWFVPMDVQEYVEIPNGMGGFSKKWNTVFSIEGVIDHVGGQEKLIANQFMEDTTHILITQDSRLKNNQRIVFNSGVYRILDVDNPMNLGRHYEVLLQYTGVDNNGTAK